MGFVSNRIAIFAAFLNIMGLTWIRQQVKLKCKHAEHWVTGSIISVLNRLINGNDYNYSMAA